MELTVTQIAERLGARLVGGMDGGERMVSAVGPLESAGEREISFVSDAKHTPKVYRSSAAAFIVGARITGLDRPQLVVGNVEAALIEAMHLFAPRLKGMTAGVDATARVAEAVEIGKGVSIGPYVVISEGVSIGADSIISAGCKIGENTKIGRGCRLDDNVVVYHNCCLGDHVVIQANSTIGSAGYGYAYIDGAYRHIPHNGGVLIEDCVEIGANCCVDRAKFGNTVIGAGTKIDNLVQIAHNVVIGKCCLMAGQAGIGGSSKLGDGVVLAGHAGVGDNIRVGSGTKIGAKSGVLLRDVGAGLELFGTPAVGKREAFRIISLNRRLPELVKQVKQMRKRIERLEASEDH